MYGSALRLTASCRQWALMPVDVSNSWKPVSFPWETTNTQKRTIRSGLRTMKGRHVRIDGTRLLFRFHGKSGQEHNIELTDRRLANIGKPCQDRPGYELFQYISEHGAACAIAFKSATKLWYAA